jgi:phosphomannomutase
MIRTNGGSIHTMEDDLYQLSKLNNGEKIVIDGIEYEMKYGKFLRASKTAIPSVITTVTTFK